MENEYNVEDYGENFLSTEYMLVKYGWIKFLLFFGMYYSFDIYGFGATNSIKMRMYKLKMYTYIIKDGKKVKISNTERRKILLTLYHNIESSNFNCVLEKKTEHCFIDIHKVEDYIILCNNSMCNYRYEELIESTNLLKDNFNDEDTNFKSLMSEVLIYGGLSFTAIIVANLFFPDRSISSMILSTFLYMSPFSVKLISKFRSVIYFNKINPYKTLYRKKYCDFIYIYGIFMTLFLILSTLIISADGMSNNELFFVGLTSINFSFYFIPWSIYFLPMYLKKYR